LTALAASLGDPAGIGPELLCEAWARRGPERLPPFFVVGGATALTAAAARRGIEVPVARIAAPEEAEQAFAVGLPVLGELDGAFTPGEPDPAGARLALASLETATALALAGDAAGVVTAPVSKALLAQVGFAFPGQTEYLADACGVAEQDAVMLLAGPQLRTVPITIHVPLSAVAGMLSAELIVSRSRIVAAALRRDFGIAHPRLAIAALNPHAGEKGNFGHEERDIVEPAIAALKAEGIDASGPHPADGLFTVHARDGYDVAICMYHDQALIPLKALDFDNGVNMTLGLPIVRTSPDHGTAFAIAGKRQAAPGATIAAIRMAGEAAANRAAHA
jgi:4-hydroxythreonine-4-phosphate dehydrogenase